jgi:hypothetical protein
MVTAKRRIARVVTLGVSVAAISGWAVGPATAVTAPPGAGKPPPASGMGTTAALNNPKCQHNDPSYGVYGRFNSTYVGGGGVCVKPWSASDDNGGATARGVTKNAITIVSVVPNDQEINKVPGTSPTKRDGSGAGTYQDAIHDLLLPYMKYYETWGRNIDMKFVVSTGDDEASQRADAVTVQALKPFAVMDFSPTGLDVLDTELANAKIITYGYSTNTKKALAQAPYRWGDADAQAAAVNASAIIGKQLARKKAEFAGSADVKNKKRTFGAVYIQDAIDPAAFKASLAKYGVKLADALSYTASGSTLGEPTTAQEQAPNIVTKLKQEGVTTMVLFTDVAMTKSLMEQATKQEWFPEWFMTGTGFADIGLLARTYPSDQYSHAFGMSILSPWVTPDPTPPPPAQSLTDEINPLNWYWGLSVGTSGSSTPTILGWLMNGLQAAGPNLTTKTFQQGLFATPASGGAAQNETTSSMSGYGRTPGLPYDEYNELGIDFAPWFWDATTSGPSSGTGTQGKGVAWYLDGAKRYTAKTVPSKPFPFFDKTNAVYKFDTRQPPVPVYVGACAGCPSQGGSGQPGTPDPAGFVATASDAST